MIILHTANRDCQIIVSNFTTMVRTCRLLPSNQCSYCTQQMGNVRIVNQ
jgi:hypothetical protein